MPLLLRWRKKRESHLLPLDDFIQAELSRGGAPDLELSVYLVEAENAGESRGEIVRLCAEHSASLALDPKTLQHFLVQDLGGIIEEQAGVVDFEFARRRHRVLRFQSAEVLRAFARRLLVERDDRLIEVTRDELVRYARDRHDAGDEDWLRVLAGEKAGLWRKLIEKSRR